MIFKTLSKKAKSLSKLDYLTIFLIIFACVCLTIKPLQNDTFYLIKIGQDILRNGLDFKDHYSWVADLSYSYPHFLLNLLCAGAFSLAGFRGIYLLTILLYIFYGLSIFYILKKLLKTPFLPNLLAFLSVVLLSIFITARAQTITYSLFAWEIYFILSLLKTGDKKYVFLLILQSWLVASLHALTWPLVFVLYLPFVVGFLVSKFLKKSSVYKNRRELKSLSSKLPLFSVNDQSQNNFKLLLFTLGGSLLIGLLSPSLNCYTGFIKIALGNSQKYISEHQPLILKSNPTAIVFLLTFLSTLIFTKTKLRLDHFFLICGLVILSFLSVRHVSLLISLGLIPLGLLLQNLFAIINPKFFEGIQKFFPKKLVFFAILVLLSLTFIDNLQGDYLNDNIAPQGVVAYLKENFSTEIASSDLRLFNEYNIGAYLLFEDIPVFIDSRAEIYTKQYTNLPRDFFDDYQQIISAADTPEIKSTSEEEDDLTYEELIKYYNFSHFLLYKTSTLAKVFAKDPNFQELYSDNSFVLYSASVPSTSN